MKVSAYGNMFAGMKVGDFHFIDMEDTIPRIASIGFKCIDLSFADSISPKLKYMFLRENDWRDRAKKLKEIGDSLGVTYNQCHAPFYHTLDKTLAEHDFNEEMTRRSFEAAEICNIPWIVMHTVRQFDEPYYKQSTELKANVEYFKPYIELAAKHNIGIAIENLFDLVSGRRRYGSTAEELLELLDALGNPENVGICWDFGHANLMKLDQVDSLRQIGKRLHAIHLHDNKGNRDEHLKPFDGNIDWYKCMKVLGEIEYDGELNYECGLYSSRLTDELQDMEARNLLALGEYLISLTK